MSSLEKRKTKLSLQTADTKFERGKSRDVCLTATSAEPRLLYFHLKGLRTAYPIDAASCLDLAIKKHVAKLRAEKLAAKKGRRAA